LLQALISRLNKEIHGLLGWQPGFLYNAVRSYNFSDFTQWLVISASGKVLTLRHPLPNGNCRFLVLAMFRRREPEIGATWMTGGGVFGVVQPGDVIEFLWPSPYTVKARPTVERILACNPDEQTVTVEVNITVDGAQESADPNMEGIYPSCKVWQQAGDPERWLPINPPAPPAQCVHCVRDYTNSVANYGAPNGVAVDAQGRHWYCRKRHYPVEKLVDTSTPPDGLPDEIQYEWKRASKADAFVAGCSQADCDCYEPSALAPIDRAPWRTRKHFGVWLKDIWAAVNVKMKQGLPGVASAMNWTVERVKHPSLFSLVGGYDLSTPVGMHERTVFPDWGGAGRYIITSVGGHEHLSPRPGYMFDATAAECTFTSPPPAGHYPASVQGFLVQHQETKYPLKHTDETDPKKRSRYAPPRQGPMLERDSGEQRGRGFARWSHVERPESLLVFPDIDFASAGAYPRAAGIVRVLATPQVVDGVVCSVVIEVPVNRQPDKFPLEIESRLVHSVEPLDDGRRKIVFVNGRHRWSYVETLERGNSRDRIIEWSAGGVWPILPEEPYRVNSYYEPHKYLGPGRGGVCAGDSVVTSTGGMLLIEDVLPHGGSEAGGWGERGVGSVMKAAGAYSPPLNALTLPDGSVGSLGTLSCRVLSDGETWLGIRHKPPVIANMHLRNLRTGEIVKVVNVEQPGHTYVTVQRGRLGTSQTAMLPDDVLESVLVNDGTARFVVLGGPRPTSIEENKCWLDSSNNLIVFSRLNAGDTVEICYTVGNTSAIELFTVPAASTTRTGLSWPDWASAVERTVSLDGVTRTDYTVEEASGQAAIVFPLIEAGKILGVSLLFSEHAQSPGDGVTLAPCYYSSFARKRDAVIVSGTAPVAPGDTVRFVASAHVLRPDLAVELSAYGSNDKAFVPGEYVKVDSGNGFVWLAKEIVDSRQERQCIYLHGQI
jgi:hypothetical protein